MRQLFIVSSIVVLTGCVNLQGINHSLKQINGALDGNRPIIRKNDMSNDRPTTNEINGLNSTKSTIHIGDKKGFRPTIEVSIPNNICNRKAFLHGFEDAYIINWNQFVNTKISEFLTEKLAEPTNPKAKKNLAFYQAHQIGTKGYIGHHMDYPRDLSGFYTNDCPFQSYQKGKSAAINQVVKDSKALVKKEY